MEYQTFSSPLFALIYLLVAATIIFFLIRFFSRKLRSYYAQMKAEGNSQIQSSVSRNIDKSDRLSVVRERAKDENTTSVLPPKDENVESLNFNVMMEQITDDLDAKLAGPGSDEQKLSENEYAIFLAYGFYDHVRYEDFTSYAFGNDLEHMQKIEKALKKIGSVDWADILSRFLRTDSELFYEQGAMPTTSDTFEFSEDYDAAFLTEEGLNDVQNSFIQFAAGAGLTTTNAKDS